MLFVVFVQHFICVEAIHTCKIHLISRIYQIIIVLNCIYYSNYFIKFIDFMSICYAINLNIVSSYIIFNYLYIEFIVSLNQ